MSSIYHPNQLVVWAHSAWKRLKVEPPIDLHEVADFLKIRVVRDTLVPGILGIYVRDDNGNAMTFIEGAMPFNEQRRILAHEIGHHLLPKKRLGYVELHYSYDNQNTPLERQCDEFAKHLLMPELYIRQKAAELGHPRINRTTALASLFGVSTDAMDCRLRELRLCKHWRRPDR